MTDKLGPWALLLAALGTFIFAILCAFCIPETMYLNKTVYHEEAIEEESATQTMAERIRTVLPAVYKQITASMATLFCRDKKLAVILLTILVMALSAQPMAFLPLYLSHRYGLAADTVCCPTRPLTKLGI